MVQQTRAVESECPEFGFWPGVRASFEGDYDSGPCLFHLDLYVILCSLFDFRVIYFTTKTQFLHNCALFITGI